MNASDFQDADLLAKLKVFDVHEAFLAAIQAHDPKGAYFLMRSAGIPPVKMLEVIKKMQSHVN